MTGPIRVLSLGSGVQSSTVALMAVAGELPAFDAVIFADTGWEPPDVYAWLEGTLRPAIVAAGMPLLTVSKGNIRADALDPDKAFASMPLYVRNAGGGSGRLRRQCTNEYKIGPVRSVTWRLYNEHDRERRVELSFGISWEESHRMTDPDVQYIDHAYPLVDRRMDRRACQGWLDDHGFGKAPKSACIGCPFRRDPGWQRMRKVSPEAFADAADFDDALREQPRLKERFGGQVFLHDARIPLRLAVDAADAQGELFEDDGGCGTAGYCAT